VDVAAKLGVPQSFVSNYESGERRLDILELRDLCEVLGITLPIFVQRLEKKLRG
jgi:transcriptional regulator with XRE-family HTH domain